MNDLKAARKSQSASSSAFQLTINEIDRLADLLVYLRSLKPCYLLAGQEVAPTTGHKHAHVYVQYERSKRLSLKKIEGAHLEYARGSAQQNIEYIKKEDTEIVAEEGAPKLKGGYSIAQVKAMKPAEREQLPLCYYNIVQKIADSEAKEIAVDDYHKEVEVYYLWGESGAGKTRGAIKMLKDKNIKTFNEIKCVDGFWHGVSDSAGAALYDDFRYTHMSASEFINFIDYNRHTFNVKGGSVRNNYSLIIITSIQSPEDLYPSLCAKDEEPKRQWMRRFKSIIKYELI